MLPKNCIVLKYCSKGLHELCTQTRQNNERRNGETEQGGKRLPSISPAAERDPVQEDVPLTSRFRSQSNVLKFGVVPLDDNT